MTGRARDKARAEARFRKQEPQAIVGAGARAEHDAREKAVEDNTARLKVLRLAKDAADAELRKVATPAAGKTRQRKALTYEPAVVAKAREGGQPRKPSSQGDWR